MGIPMTALEVLKAATGYLAQHGVENPRLNAEHLLAHVLGKEKRIDLYLEFDRPLGEKERTPLRELAKRRSQGVPLQHLLGTVEFCGRIFRCDSRALIPRPETEQLVELVLKETPHARSLVDVGTGSGVIAASLALAWPEAIGYACDISKDALALASENIACHDLENQISLIHCNLLEALTGPFDTIVANLPYIPTSEISSLAREVHYDPLTALDGGLAGLDLIECLMPAAKKHLSPGGLIALEIGHDQSEMVCAMLAEHNYRDIASHADYQGIQRFVTARHG
jgi:release factor glutamine methyltransferase